jgi:hypothetical protein
MIRKTIDKIIFRKKSQRNSPNWAFMEGFRIPSLDPPYPDYLWRIRILQTPLFGIMLHKICLPDSRPTLHNHPWPFVSIVLRGGYVEFVPGPFYAKSNYIRRINVKRFKNSFHWIAELDRNPTWTLVFVGRRRRTWGYLDRDGIFTLYNEHEFNDQYLKALESRGGGDIM